MADGADGQQAVVRASVDRANELKMKKAWEVALSYVFLVLLHVCRDAAHSLALRYILFARLAQSGEIAAHASVHAIHVRLGNPDFLHGHRMDAVDESMASRLERLD